MIQRLFTANNETLKQHLQQVLLSNNEAADKKWDARIDTMEQNMKQHVQQLREDFEKLVAQLEHRASPDRKEKETFSKLKRKRIDGRWCRVRQNCHLDTVLQGLLQIGALAVALTPESSPAP